MGLVRFGVSLEKGLLKSFDSLCRDKKYDNRSEAIRDLIRDNLVKEEWKTVKGDVAGIISIVYDHHKRELIDTLISIQHDHQKLIVSSQHVHLDHSNCLEAIVVKGNSGDVRGLAARLRSVKGVKHGELVMTTTGKIS
jgi:CopG family nickel-responsive transcriptional regulator